MALLRSIYWVSLFPLFSPFTPAPPCFPYFITARRCLYASTEYSCTESGRFSTRCCPGWSGLSTHRHVQWLLYCDRDTDRTEAESRALTPAVQNEHFSSTILTPISSFNDRWPICDYYCLSLHNRRVWIVWFCHRNYKLKLSIIPTVCNVRPVYRVQIGGSL